MIYVQGNIDQLPAHAQPSDSYFNNNEPTNRMIEEDDQPMICYICEDKATGLHYGIITCEGCKGFFKRTVQNKKNYVCLRGAQCPVTIATRKKCPACRSVPNRRNIRNISYKYYLDSTSA